MQAALILMKNSQFNRTPLYMFDLVGNSKRNRTKQFPPLPLFSQQLFSYSTMRSRSVWF